MTQHSNMITYTLQMLYFLGGPDLKGICIYIPFDSNDRNLSNPWGTGY